MFCACETALEPHSVNDYAAGQQLAQATGKRQLLIFDLYGSSNGYVQEILEGARTKPLLASFVVTHLYVDDRQWRDSLQTVGQHNTALQKQLTGAFYQPMFCVVDNAGGLLGVPFGYGEEEGLVGCLEGLGE